MSALAITRPLERGLGWLSHRSALTGGMIMLGLAIMTVASIIGRSLFGTSVEGDYELVEVGLGMSVFLFLPECYRQKGHVVVDLFTTNCKPKTLFILDRVADVFYLVLSCVLVWRLSVGGMEAYEYLEQSMILELPLWSVYAVGVFALALMGLCALSRLLKGSSE